MNERLHAYALCSVLLGAMLAPAFRDADDDSFPLSTYPMFAHERGRTESITSAVFVGPDGREGIVPSSYITNVEPMQSIATLRRAVSAGPKAASALCRAIAGRLAQSGDPALAGATRVMIVSRSVDAIAFLAGQVKSGGGKLRSQCKVARRELP